MPGFHQIKLHDNAVPSVDVLLHATSKQNNSNLSGDIGTLLFWRTLGMPGHA